MKKIQIILLLLCIGLLQVAQAQKVKIINDSIFISDQLLSITSILDLSELGLERLPKNLNDFSAVKEINLTNNQIKSLEGISQLSRLEVLILDQNFDLLASSLNGELEQLDSLQKLSIKNSNLIYIPHSIFKLKTLKELNLQNNQIELISFEIRKLKQLQKLDLSNNKIGFIDNGIQSLRQLKDLNISGNTILDAEHFLLQLSTLNRLEELNIDECNILADPIPLESVRELTVHQQKQEEQHFLLQAFPRIEELNIQGNTKEEELRRLVGEINPKTLKVLAIKNDKIRSLPESLSELRKLETLQLKCENLETIPASINRLKQLQKLELESNQLALSSAVAKLIPLKNLEALSISVHGKMDLPNSLSSLSKLKSLTVESETLEELPKVLKNLQNLEQFQITTATTSIENLDYLKEEMPKCEFIINSVKNTFEEDVLQPPLTSTNISFDEYYINAAQKQSLRTPSGSEVVIPENAFLNKAGEVVKGKVKIVYREFADPIDMALAGVPMTETINGETYTYSSAGMMEFRAFQENEELFPNPEQLIDINYNSPFQGEEYDLFYLDPQAKKWENIGKDSITQQTAVTISNEPIEWKTAPKRPEIPSFPYRKTKLNLSVNYNKKNKTTYLHLHGDQNSRRGKRDTANKVFSDLKYFSKTKWKIDDTDPKKRKLEIEKLADKMVQYDLRANRIKRRSATSTYRWGQLNYLEDFWLEPNSEQDNFYLVLSLSGELIKIPVTPLNVPKRPETAQRKVVRIYKSYQKNFKKRKMDWDKVDTKFGVEVDDYNSSMASYEQDLAVYREEMEEYNRIELEELKTFPATDENVVRSFTLSSFGVFNCDIINRMEEPRKLLAELTDENGEKLAAEKLYVLDKETNGLLTFNDPEEAVFEYKHTNSLIVILPNEKIAVLNSKQFNADQLMQITNQAKLKVFNMKNTSVADLRKNADFF